MRKRISAGGIGLLLAAMAGPADAGAPVLEAAACRVRLTPAGQGSWRASFIYRAMSGTDGRLVRLERVSVRPESDLGGFVELRELEACLLRWRFAASHSYSVAFQAGTTGTTLRQWVIEVTPSSGGESFRLVL